MASIRIAQRLQRRRSAARIALRFALCCAGALGCGGAKEADGADDSALVVLLPRDALEIDPRFTRDAYGLKLSRLLFASLVTIDPDTLEVVPDLAERVDIETPTRYRVRLKPGLRFSDGSVLDAEDVAATFRSVVDPALGTAYARTYLRIARIEVLDARNLAFELDGPHASFLTDLELPILRAEDEHRHIGVLGQPAPAGAGPFVLAHREAGRIELRANPRWHRGAPRHAAVRMLVVRDDNTRALRLLAGAGDLAINAVPPLLLPLFERDPRFVVESAPGVATTYMGVNLDAPALRDVRVRRALAHAIDRQAIVRAKLGGRARLAQGWIVPGHWAHADGVARYAYDPEKARALLREAGLAPDGNGSSLRLTMRCSSDRFRLSIARAIVAMLAEVGVEVELRPSEVATLIADLNRGRFELTMLEVPEVIEPHVLQWFFASNHVPGVEREGANRWRLRSPALDAALERGRANVQRTERIAAYAEVQRILAEQLPVIPLWHEDVVAVGGARAGSMRVPRLPRFDLLAR